MPEQQPSTSNLQRDDGTCFEGWIRDPQGKYTQVYIIPQNSSSNINILNETVNHLVETVRNQQQQIFSGKEYTETLVSLINYMRRDLAEQKETTDKVADVCLQLRCDVKSILENLNDDRDGSKSTTRHCQVKDVIKTGNDFSQISRHRTPDTWLQDLSSTSKSGSGSICKDPQNDKASAQLQDKRSELSSYSKENKRNDSVSYNDPVENSVVITQSHSSNVHDNDSDGGSASKALVQLEYLSKRKPNKEVINHQDTDLKIGTKLDEEIIGLTLSQKGKDTVPTTHTKTLPGPGFFSATSRGQEAIKQYESASQHALDVVKPVRRINRATPKRDVSTSYPMTMPQYTVAPSPFTKSEERYNRIDLKIPTAIAVMETISGEEDKVKDGGKDKGSKEYNDEEDESRDEQNPDEACQVVAVIEKQWQPDCSSKVTYASQKATGQEQAQNKLSLAAYASFSSQSLPSPGFFLTTSTDQATAVAAHQDQVGKQARFGLQPTQSISPKVVYIADLYKVPQRTAVTLPPDTLINPSPGAFAFSAALDMPLSHTSPIKFPSKSGQGDDNEEDDITTYKSYNWPEIKPFVSPPEGKSKSGYNGPDFKPPVSLPEVETKSGYNGPEIKPPVSLPEVETNSGYNGPEIKPPVSLPEVETKSGEEDENVLFINRAKLYRFIEGQWKERGLGAMKILEHKETHVMRVLMRREQVLKVCANHRIKPDMDISFKDEEKKTVTWRAIDHTDDEARLEQFCCKFKTPDIAHEFKMAFEYAKIAKNQIKPEEKK